MLNKDKKEFDNGLIWNYVSVAIMALSGVTFSLLIMLFYDAYALGVFNRVYAYYIVLSQVAVCGIHMSISKNIPLNIGNKAQLKNILATAMVEVFLTSILVIALVGGVGFLFWSNKEIFLCTINVLPALLFFSLNKVILSFYNGLSKMVIYAILQSARYIMIAVSICLLALLKANYMQITFSFLIAEVLVFMLGMFFLAKSGMISLHCTKEWFKEHMRFGLRILPANIVLELNTKVDIICLGWLISDNSIIGVYSFAVLFAEGFYQIFVVIRRSINPLITQNYFLGSEKDLQELITDVKKRIWKYALILGVLIIVGYTFLCILINKHEYLNGILALSIICFSIAVTHSFIVFGNVFSQIGEPQIESIINIGTVCCNFVFNLLFIYFWGITGAAIATAISYFFFAFMMKFYLKRKEKISI